MQGDMSELPEDVIQYLQIIEKNSDHPHIKSYFHQITLCYLQTEAEPIPFYLIEFRDNLNSGMVWTDGNGNWGTGGWLALESESSNALVAISYLQNSQAYPSCLDAIDALVNMKRGKS